MTSDFFLHFGKWGFQLDDTYILPLLLKDCMQLRRQWCETQTHRCCRYQVGPGLDSSSFSLLTCLPRLKSSAVQKITNQKSDVVLEILTGALFPLVLQILEEIKVALDVDKVHDKQHQSPDWHYTHFRAWKVGKWIQARLVQNQAQPIRARFAFKSRKGIYFEAMIMLFLPLCS